MGAKQAKCHGARRAATDLRRTGWKQQPWPWIGQDRSSLALATLAEKRVQDRTGQMDRKGQGRLDRDRMLFFVGTKTKNVRPAKKKKPRP